MAALAQSASGSSLTEYASDVAGTEPGLFDLSQQQHSRSILLESISRVPRLPGLG